MLELIQTFQRVSIVVSNPVNKPRWMRPDSPTGIILR
jgi:hypothetical protein